MRNAWLALALAAVNQGAFGQAVLTYPGCNVTYNASNWTQETLVKRTAGSGPGGVVDGSGGQGLWEPTKLAVTYDAEGSIEVYFTELGGAIKVYRKKSNTVARLAVIPVDTVWSTGDEMGLMGVAIDPKFKTNNRIYLYSSPRGTPYWRVSRHTVNAERTGLTNEQIVFQFAVQKKECCHTGGGMHFDDLGDLYVSVGNNEGRASKGINEGDSVHSGEAGAANTMSIRGSIIRIRPLETPVDGKLYAIPKGNFGEYWAEKFATSNPTLAAEYKTKVMPELFVKGNRNPYGIAVDRVRRWVAVGDVGPDGDDPAGSSMGEDHDMYLAPAYAGWPYWAGKNRVNAGSNNPAAPLNKSKWNKGVSQLPPAHTPLWEERNGSSFAGFFYRYDKSNPSTVKLPAIFHKHVIWGTWGGSFSVSKFNDDGTMVGSGPTTVFGNISKSGPTDIQLGPDGAVYVVNYAGFFNADPATRIDRYVYKGAQCDVDVPFEKAGCKDKDPTVTLDVPDACTIPVSVDGYIPVNPNLWRKLSATLGGLNNVLVLPAGTKNVEIFNLQGRKVFTYHNAQNASSLTLPAGFQQGIYQVMMSK